MLNMLASGMAIDFFIGLITSWGRLFGPAFLLVSKLDIISSISVGDVGFIMKELVFGFFR